jgi:hypothetical protein
MKCSRYTIAFFLASLAVAATWTATVRADDDVPLTAEEKAELAVKRQEVLHDRQMKGLGACILAAIFVGVLFWALNRYNKVQKQKVELERKEVVPNDDIPNRYVSPQPTALPLEPPPGDW